MLNATEESVPKIIDIIPGLDSPAIVPLNEKGMVALHSVIDEEIFWEVIDELLNAVLFLLIGFELLNINVNNFNIVPVLLMIPLVLLVRLITVAIPMKFIDYFHIPLKKELFV